jgi:hypothetical protein
MMRKIDIGSGKFKIKCSKVENRLELLGALREAEQHILVNGYSAAFPDHRRPAGAAGGVPWLSAL